MNTSARFPHIVPHLPLILISTRPSKSVDPFTSLIGGIPLLGVPSNAAMYNGGGGGGSKSYIDESNVRPYPITGAVLRTL